MAEPKAFASLGPTLLARKGAARPAMRPQFGLFGSKGMPSPEDLEDLGWNDVGEEEDEYTRPAPLPLTPAQKVEHEDEPEVEEDDSPAVLKQQRELAERLASVPGPVPAPAKGVAARKVSEPPHRRRGTALEAGRRAAFTLRLDAERHLKLRLASTLRNLSSQQIVTEALDRFLDQLPEVETLAAQVKREQNRS